MQQLTGTSPTIARRPSASHILDQIHIDVAGPSQETLAQLPAKARGAILDIVFQKFLNPKFSADYARQLIGDILRAHPIAATSSAKPLDGESPDSWERKLVQENRARNIHRYQNLGLEPPACDERSLSSGDVDDEDGGGVRSALRRRDASLHELPLGCGKPVECVHSEKLECIGNL
ncbi:hypothetical protein HDU87_003621 [Geranomyces variabilis]|uniref:Uncharacterized protein n=1 Tax=Geranomyces variabilis TaxID=109894 RepID=A0AAD5TKF2_9FUNG|nr:hypothetical protein HDU87_003621 [Geranomyces variabilis]